MDQEPLNLLTVLIAGAALGISLVSLYFNLRQKTALVGSLTRWDSIESEDLFVNCEITLSNTGNQELMLREVRLDHDANIDMLYPVLETDAYPTVVKPGQVMLLTLPVPQFYMSELEVRDKKMWLVFEIFTAKAKPCFAYKKLTPYPTGDVPNEDWEPFGLASKWQQKRIEQRLAENE